MSDDQMLSLESQYAEAIRHERDALHALRAQEPGSDANARAWQEWSEAITRTNRAWRELSSHARGRAEQQHPMPLPVIARASAPGARAPSR